MIQYLKCTRRMSEIVEGQEDVLCHVDDVLVFAPTQQEHATDFVLP